jgi:hypothetical protein
LELIISGRRTELSPPNNPFMHPVSSNGTIIAAMKRHRKVVINMRMV